MTLPVKSPLTFPLKVDSTWSEPKIVILFPIVSESLMVALPCTWSGVVGFVSPIPNDPPIPVKVINVVLLIPLCQWKPPAVAAALFALK